MSAFPGQAFAKSEKISQSRAIAIAYDTSGSMADESDKWCNAKYSLEVIAAMLDAKDSLDIYFMNYGIDPAEAPLSVKGSEPITDRVKKVHDRQYRESLETVPNAAMEALDYLKGRSDADERYLVITTDGEFTYTSDGRQDGAAASQEVRNVVSDAVGQGIKVIYLAIGDDAQSLEGFEGNPDVSMRKASSADVLPTMTKMVNDLFGRASIPVNGNKISLDVPMSNLIVFAQGSNVKVGSLSGNNEKVDPKTATVDHNTEPFSSKEDNDRWKNHKTGYKVNDRLKGVVAFYDKELARGDYELSVEGVEDNSLEVYYTPNVDIKVTLTDDEFDEKHELDSEGGTKLATGEFTVQMSLVDPSDGTALESELLKGAEYKLEVNNGGTTKTVENGQKLTLELGQTSFKPEATVPGGVKTKRSYDNITVVPRPGKLNVNTSGVATSVPVNDISSGKGTLMVTKEDGGDLSADEWDRLKIEPKSENGLNWDIKKTDKIGTVEVTPAYGDEDAAALSTRVLGGGPIGGYQAKDVETKFDASVDDEAHPLRGQSDAKTTVQPDVVSNLLRNLVFYIGFALLIALVVAFIRKPRLPRLEPKLVVGGRTYELLYDGRIRHRFMLPWSPETAHFSTMLAIGNSGLFSNCFTQFDVGVVAVRGRGRRFKLDDDTIATLVSLQESSGIDPKYSCVIKRTDKKGNAVMTSKVYGKSGSFRFYGKRLKGSGKAEYRIKFS